jgi:hypothetical protein
MPEKCSPELWRAYVTLSTRGYPRSGSNNALKNASEGWNVEAFVGDVELDGVEEERTAV